jgi:hypothetical protein
MWNAEGGMKKLQKTADPAETVNYQIDLHISRLNSIHILPAAI